MFLKRYAALHWDGKLIKDVTGCKQENEAILVSGSPSFIEGKLLSVVKLTDGEGKPTSTGEAQAQAVMEQIEIWDITDNIVALVYDTTSSNTGVHKGATVRIVKQLGRPVFFLGCRHHISELVVKACWYSLFEEDLSPDCKLFLEFKNTWESLDHEADIVLLEDSSILKQEAIQFYTELLQKKKRNDELMIR